VELISFQNSIEVCILLALHVVQVYPLHLDNWCSLSIDHRVVPVMLKESPETLVGVPFLERVVTWLLTKRDDVPFIHFVVVDHFLVGVSYQGPYLQTLKLIGCWRSGTTRRGVLGRGLLMESDGPSPLGELLGMR
jgi:hypothetical protein